MREVGEEIKTLDTKINTIDGELEEIANAQREALYRNHPLDKAVQQAELSEVLK